MLLPSDVGPERGGKEVQIMRFTVPFAPGTTTQTIMFGDYRCSTGGGGPMKALIVYYSAGGRTQKIAEAIAAAMDCEKDLINLEPKESIGFFDRFRLVMRGQSVPVRDTTFDCAPYDVVLQGAPVWTHKANPVIKGWVDRCQNMDGKRIGLFATCRFRRPGMLDDTAAEVTSRGATVAGSLVVQGFFSIGVGGLDQARSFGDQIASS